MTTNPESDAEWRTLLARAEIATGSILGERLEAYLIHLLIRFATRPGLLEGLLALDQLTSDPGEQERIAHLQNIGDQCLLFAGLFPDQAEQRGVRLSHFISLGRTAYQQLHEIVTDDRKWLFAHLADEFTSLLDLLHTMHELCDDSVRLTPLQAFDLWNDTGSARALRFILASTGAYPVPPLPHHSAHPMQ